jgi:putative peptidoglycan lipid II flippase
MTSIVRASAVMGAGTVVSRLLGFIKAIVLAQALGVVASAGADSFAVANQMPNNLYVIIAGGVLSATLVPAIVRSTVHSDGGTAYINKLMTIALSVLTVMALAATLLAPVLVRLYATHWSENQLALATAFTYWCLPQIFFYGLYALLGEILNARSIFGPFTWAPMLNNIISIVGLVVFILIFGADSSGARSVTDWTPGMVALIAGTATTGIAAQALILLVFWRKLNIRFRLDFAWRGVGLRETGKMAGWTFGMIVATQLAGLVETNVSALASGQGASVFAFQTAWLAFMLPHSIIAVSLATAYFTRISQHAAADNDELVREDAVAAIRRILTLILWASAGLFSIAIPFSRLFSTSFGDTLTLASIIMVLVLGLPAFSALFVLLRVFFALGDGRTPFVITLFQAVTVSVVLIGVAFLPRENIVFGVGLTLTVVGTIQTLLAAWLLRRKLKTKLDARVGFALLRGVIAAIVASVVGLYTTYALGGFTASGFPESGFVPAIVSMILIAIPVTLVFVAVLAGLRSPELAEGISVLRGLRRRKSAE